MSIYIPVIIIGEQGAIGTLTEWQNLYPRREIMVLGMGLKEAAANRGKGIRIMKDGKYRKNKLVISVVIIIIIIILFTSLLYYRYNRLAGSHRSDKDEFMYVIDINPESDNFTYRIITPVPVKGYSSDMEEIIQDRFIQYLYNEQGMASYELIETEYGFGLEIIGHGHVILNSSDPSGDIRFHNLNMQDIIIRVPADANVGSFEYWTYSNSSSLIEIKLYCYGRWGSGWYFDSHTSEVNGTLYNGWNLINGTEMHRTG